MFLWNVLTDLSVLSADNVETELVSKSLNLVLFCFLLLFVFLLSITTADHLPSSQLISNILCCHRTSRTVVLDIEQIIY